MDTIFASNHLIHRSTEHVTKQFGNFTNKTRECVIAFLSTSAAFVLYSTNEEHAVQSVCFIKTTNCTLGMKC